MDRSRELLHLLRIAFPDDALARAWFQTSVPMLGGRTPASLLEEGRVDEVIGVLAGLQSGAHI